MLARLTAKHEKSYLTGEEEVVHAFNGHSVMQITGAPPARSSRKTQHEFISEEWCRSCGSRTSVDIYLHSNNTNLPLYNNYSFLRAHILKSLVLYYGNCLYRAESSISNTILA